MSVLDVISCVGLTMIITQSYIFKPIREYFKEAKHLYKLLNCTMCMGFWVGVLMFQSFQYALVSSISSYTYYLLMKYFVDKYD